MRLSVMISRNDDGFFQASCPSLPGCVATAQTRDEAHEKLSEAIRGYLAAVGNFVPERIERKIVEV